ncbi:hypothetical protein RGQ29_024321 [Quercus rubra]|uniref:Uncharacterized protein n=1 Tax=Quercus rubra TaxID=3512 RepID=A0AAN7IGF6_QUERU|nr:hypothetical protein RGQ29_024321 [Quercus rubra]
MGTNTNTITLNLNLNLKLKLSPTQPKSKILCKNNSAFEENKQVSVDHEILSLHPHDDIEGVLNRWIGRFARKNFPLLIREITRGSIERSIQVFWWMKNQKNYCPRNDIYNIMIRLHARHNRTDQAHGFLFF